MAREDQNSRILRAFLWTAAILISLPILAVGVVLVLLWTSEPPFLPEPAPCDEALRPAGIDSLPAGATDLDCQAGGFQESVAIATMTTSTRAVEQWITAELPGTVLGSDACGDADRCAHLEADTPGSPLTPSWRLEIDIHDLSGDRASVRIHAYTA